jgi:hypothetical protein
VVLDDLDEDKDRQLAYIGLSRARSMLVVIAPTAVLINCVSALAGSHNPPTRPSLSLEN